MIMRMTMTRIILVYRLRITGYWWDLREGSKHENDNDKDNTGVQNSERKVAVGSLLECPDYDVDNDNDGSVQN